MYMLCVSIRRTCKPSESVWWASSCHGIVLCASFCICTIFVSNLFDYHKRLKGEYKNMKSQHKNSWKEKQHENCVQIEKSSPNRSNFFDLNCRFFRNKLWSWLVFWYFGFLWVVKFAISTDVESSNSNELHRVCGSKVILINLQLEIIPTIIEHSNSAPLLASILCT